MDPLDALKMAMKREEDGQRFYNEAAARSTNEKSRQMFEWLAHEETGHLKLLDSAIAELKSTNGWLTQDMWGSGKHITEPIKDSDFPSKPKTLGALSPDATELQILKKAIDAEKADAAFYAKVAESIEDPNGKIMLEKLAHVEKGHQGLLEEEYEWISKSKQYFTLHRFLRFR